MNRDLLRGKVAVNQGLTAVLACAGIVVFITVHGFCANDAPTAQGKISKVVTRSAVIRDLNVLDKRHGKELLKPSLLDKGLLKDMLARGAGAERVLSMRLFIGMLTAEPGFEVRSVQSSPNGSKIYVELSDHFVSQGLIPPAMEHAKGVLARNPGFHAEIINVLQPLCDSLNLSVDNDQAESALRKFFLGTPQMPQSIEVSVAGGGEFARAITNAQRLRKERAFAQEGRIIREFEEKVATLATMLGEAYNDDGFKHMDRESITRLDKDPSNSADTAQMLDRLATMRVFEALGTNRIYGGRTVSVQMKDKLTEVRFDAETADAFVAIFPGEFDVSSLFPLAKAAQDFGRILIMYYDPTVYHGMSIEDRTGILKRLQDLKYEFYPIHWG